MTVADRIKNRREKLNMTQEQLAKACGWSSKTSVSRIENSGDDITQKQIVKCANALGTTPMALMGWDKERTINQMVASIMNDIMELPDDDPKKEIILKIGSLTPEQASALWAIIQNFK